MTQEKNSMLAKAKSRMADDMKAHGLGAIIWSIPDAGFHFIPELSAEGKDGNRDVVRVAGLYLYRDTLYAIAEDTPGTEMRRYYRKGIDVPPVVVTLTPDKAEEIFGTPRPGQGFTTGGSLEEWVTVADCYFEALREE